MIEPGSVSCNDVEWIHTDFSGGNSHDALPEPFPTITVHTIMIFYVCYMLYHDQSYNRRA